MNWSLAEEPLFMDHYEFRAGRWWVCRESDCDGRHHYYTHAPQP